MTGEIREPRHFKGLILPYNHKTNERFKKLMDCLNDRLSKKDLGAFYTPEEYAKKAAELVVMAVERAIAAGKKDYVILDRCAGTGSLEAVLIGLKDSRGDELINHCVVSTYEYYEYKVLNERIGDKVRDIVPSTEGDIVFGNGKILNADAMTKEYIENAVIKQYIDDDDCAVILFENPPYRDEVSDNSENRGAKINQSFVFKELFDELKNLRNSSIATARDLSNQFIKNRAENPIRRSDNISCQAVGWGRMRVRLYRIVSAFFYFRFRFVYFLFGLSGFSIPCSLIYSSNVSMLAPPVVDRK